ncbi:unnamed protein product [Diabrotica balteata]|uniref:ODAD1 central coiled coil region domain-containing protein n=1 Tax=Diabrotica balteata TaxID=107213 RepID=A0A9N9T1F5_DIABA|nr:unnamed protein product [Diabrotica balteata]
MNQGRGANSSNDKEMLTMAEEELARLHRQLRIMDEDRIAFLEETGTKLKKQRKIMQTLKREREKISEEINVATCLNQKRNDEKLVSRMKKLVEDYEKYDSMVKNREGAAERVGRNAGNPEKTRPRLHVTGVFEYQGPEKDSKRFGREGKEKEGDTNSKLGESTDNVGGYYETNTDEQIEISQLKEKERQHNLEYLRAQLETVTRETLKNEENVKNSENKVKAILEGIEDIFDLLLCDRGPILGLLGTDSSMNLFNVKIYLGTIEKKITGLITRLYFAEKAVSIPK